MKNIIIFSLFLCCAQLFSVQAMAAQICNDRITATTPTSRYVLDDVYGTALDTKTGLMWKRCIEGYVWNNGSTCVYEGGGASEVYIWASANWRVDTANASNFAGYNDWRMPNLKELSSIVERRCQIPAINLNVFKLPIYTGPLVYRAPWEFITSTPYQSIPDRAWVVEFGLGQTSSWGKGALRLVRGGQ